MKFPVTNNQCMSNRRTSTNSSTLEIQTTMPLDLCLLFLSSAGDKNNYRGAASVSQRKLFGNEQSQPCIIKY